MPQFAVDSSAHGTRRWRRSPVQEGASLHFVACSAPVVQAGASRRLQDFPRPAALEHTVIPCVGALRDHALEVSPASSLSPSPRRWPSAASPGRRACDASPSCSRALWPLDSGACGGTGRRRPRLEPAQRPTVPFLYPGAHCERDRKPQVRRRPLCTSPLRTEGAGRAAAGSLFG